MEGNRVADTVAVLGVLSLMINLVGLAPPLALLQVYNRIIPNQGETTLSILVLGVFGALLVEGVLRWFRSYYTGWLGARFEHNSGCDVFRRLLHAPPAELEKAEGAQHLERMGAIQTAGELYSGQAMLALFDLPFLFLYLILIYRLGGALVLAPLLSMALVAAVSLKIGQRMRKTLTTDMQLSQRRFGFLTETLSRIHSIKSMAMEALMVRRYELLQNIYTQQTREIIFLGAALPTISSFASQATTAIVVTFGAMSVMSGDLTTGGLAACTMLAGRTLQPLQTLVNGWTRLQNIRLARQQVDELLALPKPTVNTAIAPSLELGGGIALDNVSFAYQPGGKNILEEISLQVRPGEIIAIMGESGVGKTTLLKLIAGRFAPSRGEVRVDGRVVGENTPEITGAIAYVPQQGTLFSGSILQNLTMYDPSRNESALRVAAQLGLDAAVSRMPKGYATVIGDGASESLPAGLVQRISIARILAMDPKIVLFDEANMAIDSAGDAMLRNALEQLKGRCTIVLNSMRPSLLRIADRSFRLADGHLEALSDFRQAFAASAPVASDAASGVVPHAPPPPLPDAAGDGSPPWALFIDRLPFQTPFTRNLKDLLTALRWNGSARQLAEAVPHFSETMDLTDLCNTMTNLNYTHRSDFGRLSDIDMRLAPFLFVSEAGEPMVVR
ncbi:MAG: ATP-binding cassette domain-containing protein, partial [Magnetococcales bacterium]|nr:ATP-binding cassette domain-containing protein [Magnetococcales bacterium]